MRRYFLLLILGSILLGAGIVLLIFELSFFSFSNYLPEHNFVNQEEYTYYSIHSKDLYIRVAGDNYYIIRDESLSNQAKITFNYYSNFISLHKTESEYANYRDVQIRFKTTHSNRSFYDQLFNLISKDLKNRKIHNYLPFFQPYIEISVNPSEMSKIKIIKY